MTAQISTSKINLTKYEKKVATQLYFSTLPNDEIATDLGISVSSVKFHSHNIYTKLKVANRLELKALDRKFVMGLIK